MGPCARAGRSCDGLLERLTEPSFDESGADEGGGEVVEGLADVGAAFVADGEAAEAGEPGQDALDDPTMPANRSEHSTPRRAMRGTILRTRQACRQAA